MIFATSDRLVIRDVEAADVDLLLPSWSDPDMTRYTGIRPDPRQFLESMIDDMQRKQPGETEPGGPWYQYAVVRREDGLLVGDIGVGFEVPGERQVELGYRIHPAHHRLGYAREAVAAMIGHLIAAHDIHRFVGLAAEANAPSIAVLRALGFRQEGRFWQSFLCDGEWMDDLYFALLASEWSAAKVI